RRSGATFSLGGVHGFAQRDRHGRHLGLVATGGRGDDALAPLVAVAALVPSAFAIAPLGALHQLAAVVALPLAPAGGSPAAYTAAAVRALAPTHATAALALAATALALDAPRRPTATAAARTLFHLAGLRPRASPPRPRQ